MESWKRLVKSSDFQPLAPPSHIAECCRLRAPRRISCNRRTSFWASFRHWRSSFSHNRIYGSIWRIGGVDEPWCLGICGRRTFRSFFRSISAAALDCWRKRDADTALARCRFRRSSSLVLPFSSMKVWIIFRRSALQNLFEWARSSL